MRTAIYVIGLVMAIILLAILLITDKPPSGAAVQERSGTVCCTFENDGALKTCAAPEGQSCDVCNSVCAARS